MAEGFDVTHFLFALVGMLFGSLSTIAAMSKYFVTRSHCLATTEHCRSINRIACAHEKEWEAAIMAQLASLNRKNDIQFRMIRALIAHTEGLTPEQRERILNEGREQ